MNIGVREGVSGVSGDTPGRRTGNGVGLETSGEKKNLRLNKVPQGLAEALRGYLKPSKIP